jgi:hypothetical protein
MKAMTVPSGEIVGSDKPESDFTSSKTMVRADAEAAVATTSAKTKAKSFIITSSTGRPRPASAE